MQTVALVLKLVRKALKIGNVPINRDISYT